MKFTSFAQAKAAMDGKRVVRTKIMGDGVSEKVGMFLNYSGPNYGFRVLDLEYVGSLDEDEITLVEGGFRFKKSLETITYTVLEES